MAHQAPVLGPHQIQTAVAVGATDHRSVRIWCRTGRPGRYRLSIRQDGREVGSGEFDITADGRTDNTRSICYPDDFCDSNGAGPDDLDPLTLYTYRVSAADSDANVVGAGRFETYPKRPDDTPDRFSIGLMSCHQPFNSDGALSPFSMRLLDKLPGALDHRVKFIIAAGDQMYADGPDELSLFNEQYSHELACTGGGPLFDCSEETIRGAYQDRYRSFWYPIKWRKLLSTYPIYPILDDHEIIDAAGALPEHQHPAYQKLFRAARSAFMDYQGSLLRPWTGLDLPSHFGYRFDYGHTGVFMFDTRSERVAGASGRDSQMISEAQHSAFQRFLRERQDARVLLIVTSVPFLHIPEWLTDIGNAITGPRVAFLDHWSLSRYVPDRDRILAAIRRQLAATDGRQKIVFLGGDVHVGAAFVLTFRDREKHQFYQFTSSPLTQRLRGWQTAPSRWGVELFEQTGTTYGGRLGVRLLRPTILNERAPNPIDVQNFGLIDVETRGEKTHIRLRFLGYDSATEGITELFSTGLL